MTHIPKAAVFCPFDSALPSHDPEEINKDIKSVDDWIKKNKDEL